MSTQLLRNPTGISDIFFSGSQTVKKGVPVTWILSDTWAFKTTEDCKVSTNASPFVDLKAGQTFIIYKRKQEDIDAGNYKGIYIFDRDTVVALAYPQKLTQDIIIENDIYNNNLSTIIVEANKTPQAKITVSSSSPVVGTPITVSGTSSYAVAPATIASYAWKLNGVSMGSASSLTYTPSVARVDDVLLVVTDNNGLKNSASASIKVRDKVDIPPVYFSMTGKGGLVIKDFNPLYIFRDTTGGIASTGTINLSVSCNVRTDSTRYGAKAKIEVFHNGTSRGHTVVQLYKKQVVAASFNCAAYVSDITPNDEFKVMVSRVNDGSSKYADIWAGCGFAGACAQVNVMVSY